MKDSSLSSLIKKGVVMRKVIFIMLAGTMLASTAHAENYGVKESEAYFGALFDVWVNSSKSNKIAVKNKIINGAEDVEGAQYQNNGWCNSAVVWAMGEVDMWGQVSKTPEWGHATMRGRDFTSHYNTKVEQHFNHNDNFDWSDVPIGSVALMDWQSSPKNWGNLGIDHTTTFMGVIEGTDYGWFLGGNQSGMLQPKMYRLSNMTYASTFNDDNANVKKHHFTDVEEYASIDLEAGSWTKSNPHGWGWGTNKKPKNDGDANSKYMSSQWNQHGVDIQKFQNGDNVVYVQDADGMEVFTKINGNQQLIRSIDYYDHVEIDEIGEHIDDKGQYNVLAWQNHGQWYAKKAKNVNRAGFKGYIEKNDFEDSQWHKEVYTAASIRDGVTQQLTDNFNAYLAGDLSTEEWTENWTTDISRTLYIDYDISYDNEEEDLETHAFD